MAQRTVREYLSAVHPSFGIVALGIIALWIFKIPLLSLPAFWDEAWVYAPAVRQLADGPIRFSPDSLPPDLLRGHPMLFHFLGASWLKIVGNSISNLHAFALIISTLTILATYRLGIRFFSAWIGAAAALWLTLQAMFIDQSVAALPEMMLTLWALLAIHAYLAEKWWQFVLFGSCLLLTKESGIALLAALGLHLLFEHFVLQKGGLLQARLWRKGGLILLPLVPAIAYFIAQRIQLGWFFFPEHMGLIDLKGVTVKSKVFYCINLLFVKEGKMIYWIVALGLSFWFGGLPRWIWLQILGLGLLLKQFDTAKPLMWTGLLSFAIFTGLLFRKVKREDLITWAADKRPILVLLFTLVAYIAFCSVNFLTARYLLFGLPLSLLLATWTIARYLPSQRIFLWGVGLLTVVQVVFTSFERNTFFAIDAVQAQRDVVRYIEQNKLHEAAMLRDFLIEVALQNPLAGFRTDAVRVQPRVFELSHAEYLVLDNITHENRERSYEWRKAGHLSEIKVIRRGQVKIEIYKIIH